MERIEISKAMPLSFATTREYLALEYEVLLVDFFFGFLNRQGERL